MKALLLLSLFASAFASIALGINQKFIVDFLNFFNINQNIVFYCNDSLNSADWKDSVKNGFKFFSFVDISSPIFNAQEFVNFSSFTYNQIGIVFDETCRRSEDVLKAFSSLNMFRAEYNWLILSNEMMNSINKIDTLHINLYAEITLAILLKENNYNLFDIYNLNSKTNGRLIVQHKGSYTSAEGLRITLTGSKFERRSNLQGAIVHAGVVATGYCAQNQTLKQFMESKMKSFKFIYFQHFVLFKR